MIGLMVEGTNYRRALINKHVSLFYEFIEKDLKVLLIWDNRQNPDDLKLKQ